MSEASFGFGQRVTKATGGEVVNIADIEALKVFFRAPGALERFGESPKTLVVLAAGTYDFTNEPFPAIEIRRKNLTITANDADVVVFKNFQLAIDLALSDNILIENLNFRSDGLPSHPRDGIKTLDNSEIKRVRGTSVSQTPVTPASLSLRITHCSFDGYFDIAIDSSVKSKPRPRLLATIDHCLFFDSRPGQPTTRVEQGGRNLFAFANRGAINITITEHGAGGNASFTVADNVFIDVWRRSPRVAEGNQAHIYNNLLFRVGKGNTEDNFANGSNEWVGMETDNGAQAAIQANRYIPWKEKLAVNKQISIGPDTDVDLGAEFTDPNDPTKSTPDLTNEFDGANGTVPSPPTVLSLTGSSTST